MKSVVSEKPSTGLALLWAFENHGGGPEQTSFSETPLPTPPRPLRLLGLPYTTSARGWAA